MFGAVASSAPRLDLAAVRDVAPQQGRIPVAYVFHLVGTEGTHFPLRNVLRPSRSSHWSSWPTNHLSHPSLEREVLCFDLLVSLTFLLERGCRRLPVKEEDAFRYYLYLSPLLAILPLPDPGAQPALHVGSPALGQVLVAALRQF